jgi:hypothetical protein
MPVCARDGAPPLAPSALCRSGAQAASGAGAAGCRLGVGASLACRVRCSHWATHGCSCGSLGAPRGSPQGVRGSVGEPLACLPCSSTASLGLFCAAPVRLSVFGRSVLPCGFLGLRSCAWFGPVSCVGFVSVSRPGLCLLSVITTVLRRAGFPTACVRRS